MFSSKSCPEGYLCVLHAGEHPVTVISNVPGARLTGLQFKQFRLADGLGLTSFLTCPTASRLPRETAQCVRVHIKDSLDRLIKEKRTTWKSGLGMFTWQLYLGWQYDVRRHFHYENKNVQFPERRGAGGTGSDVTFQRDVWFSIPIYWTPFWSIRRLQQG